MVVVKKAMSPLEGFKCSVVVEDLRVAVAGRTVVVADMARMVPVNIVLARVVERVVGTTIKVAGTNHDAS